MTHEHDPDHPERDGQDQHAPEQSGDPGSSGSTPAYPDPFRPSLRQHRHGDHPSNQPALPGLPDDLNQQVIGLQYSGPTPHSSEIQRLNEISPGMGNRIMDDAHDDIVHDRTMSERSFDYVIWESKRRLNVATGLTCLSFGGIFLTLFLLDPPESLVGAGLCGIGASTPIILGLLHGRPHPRDEQGKAPEQPTSSPHSDS
ncbi:DUF2335 domain-containing protein [Corynebacterium bovis]|uniref:DUF2335 domain-containing protein n=1 Tax=Corynebacterium bovis TaxID=36808 RepID=UPI00244D3A9F|nr:DUF2335 domain-containing protein [Corynebacterium bovis]MDH2455339.1 DUF2335 domain-containing protein [Corynebacterium bovis]